MPVLHGYILIGNLGPLPVAQIWRWLLPNALKSLIVSLSICGVIGISEVRLNAQAVAGAQIAGIVTDPAGAAVPGAQLTATQTETNTSYSAVSGVNGAYVMPYLPVGPYRLEVSASGFAKYVQTGILLSVGNNVAVNVALTIGSTQQQVQVSADAAMVETRDTATSQVIDQQRVLDLPLNGRQ